MLGPLLWRLAGYSAGAAPLASRRVRCWGQGTVLGPLLSSSVLAGYGAGAAPLASSVSQGTVLGPLLWRLAGYGAGAVPLGSRRVRCWGRSSSVSQGTVLGLLL